MTSNDVSGGSGAPWPSSRRRSGSVAAHAGAPRTSRQHFVEAPESHAGRTTSCWVPVASVT
ncbi:MAG TPA: hypothetical protein VHJ20_06275 [Polyangia bacterium]|nr:hypothetical protein [Polyangia bacterium]